MGRSEVFSGCLEYIAKLWKKVSGSTRIEKKCYGAQELKKCYGEQEFKKKMLWSTRIKKNYGAQEFKTNVMEHKNF